MDHYICSKPSHLTYLYTIVVLPVQHRVLASSMSVATEKNFQREAKLQSYKDQLQRRMTVETTGLGYNLAGTKDKGTQIEGGQWQEYVADEDSYKTLTISLLILTPQLILCFYYVTRSKWVTLIVLQWISNIRPPSFDTYVRNALLSKGVRSRSLLSQRLRVSACTCILSYCICNSKTSVKFHKETGHTQGYHRTTIKCWQIYPITVCQVSNY